MSTTAPAPTPIEAALIGHRVSVAYNTSTARRFAHGWLMATSAEAVELTTGKRPGIGAPVAIPRVAITAVTHLRLDCRCDDGEPGEQVGYVTRKR